MKILYVTIFTFLFVYLPCSAEMRTWTSTKGQTIEAEYVRHSMGKIVLKRADGKEITIPPEYLSEEDQTYASRLVPPKLDLDFSKTEVSKNRGGFTSANYKGKDTGFYVKIGKKSREPYDRKLKVELFILGKNLHSNEKVMLFEKVWTDVMLSNEYGEVLELSTKPIKLASYKGSSGYAAGTMYDSYAFFVFDDTGNLLDSRASVKNLLEKLPILRSGELYDL